MTLVPSNPLADASGWQEHRRLGSADRERTALHGPTQKLRPTQHQAGPTQLAAPADAPK